MTPYAQMLATHMRPEAQATYAYEYRRYAKDPALAFVLTLVLGIVGGESYYLGNYARGILMSLALLSGIALIVTVPMWIVRCFTVQNEVDANNDYLAYMLALRYWPHSLTAAEGPPAPPESPVPPRSRPTIAGVPMTIPR